MHNLYIVGGLFLAILIIFVLIYQKGKNAKEKEIIEQNEELKKQYGKKTFKSINDVVDSL